MLTDTLPLAARLRRNLRLSRDELEALQRKKLRALLRHSYGSVPYYRNLFTEAGIEPEDINGAEDLHRIPVTSKTSLQGQPPEQILAKGLDTARALRDVTSGSTGIPLKVYFTREDYLIRSLVFIRTFMAGGYRLTDRQAIVCDTRFTAGRTHWYQKLGVFQKRYIPVHLDLDRQIEMLREYRPGHIHGYPKNLALIAGELLRRGLRDISPRVLHTGAELVSGKERALINAAFGVDMLDTYASIESGLIAWECPAHCGYHINMDCTVLELLADGRPARTGEHARAVVTNLHSYAMPIIRYELGDVCLPSDATCTCGSHLPLMGIVEGRVDDMVRTPTGRMVSPNSLTNALEAVDGIRQFRIIQKAVDTLLVLTVPGIGFSERTPAVIRGALGDLVGKEVRTDVSVVAEIPREPTGKIRAVVSEIGRTADS
jgi:phenylacetate-CoA ligase